MGKTVKAKVLRIFMKSGERIDALGDLDTVEERIASAQGRWRGPKSADQVMIEFTRLSGKKMLLLMSEIKGIHEV